MNIKKQSALEIISWFLDDGRLKGFEDERNNRTSAQSWRGEELRKGSKRGKRNRKRKTKTIRKRKRKRRKRKRRKRKRRRKRRRARRRTIRARRRRKSLEAERIQTKDE